MTTRSSSVKALSTPSAELDERRSRYIGEDRLPKHFVGGCPSQNVSARWYQPQTGRLAICILGMATTMLSLMGPSKAAEYQVRSGDVLELAVISAPELNRRVPVEINGNATFPLIGELEVDGVELEKLRETVRTLLENSIYRPSSEASDLNTGIIQKKHVSLRVAVYRPVYVTGAVAKPGEIPFRPGLTVRQAISIAGGYDPLGARRTGLDKNPNSIVELNGELAMVKVAIAETDAQIWRLRTALGEATKPELPKPEFVASSLSAKIFALQKAHLESSQADQHIEKTYLEGAIRQSEKRVKALLRLAEREAAGAQLDEESSERVSQLFEKGLVSAERLSQVRRLVLMSTTRALQTQVAVEQEKNTTREFASRLERLDSIRRVKLREELTQENTKATHLRLKMATIIERLQTIGITPPGINTPLKSIVISRSDAQNSVTANEDVRLLPGDVVEVAFRPD